MFSFFKKKRIKSLAKEMVSYVDIVKLTLYRVLTTELSERYAEKGGDFSGRLSAAMINEIFDMHSDKITSFVEKHKDVVTTELKAFAERHPDFKRPITDSMRVLYQCGFMLTGEVEENWSEHFQRVTDLGLFIKGGNAPNPSDFKVMVNALAERYRVQA